MRIKARQIYNKPLYIGTYTYLRLLYILDLGSGALRRGGSSPLIRTILTPLYRDTLQLQIQLIY